MSKTYYSDCSNYYFRYYIKNPFPNFENEVMRLKWEACERVYKSFTKFEKEIISYIYLENGSIIENAKSVSIIKGIPMNLIWQLLNNLESRVAIEIGII